ncbi:MAG: SGNH/GDSL hydrolase family protein [Acidobacteria bacterium]|nr:SGNH/GDSL hydrolase family protein [Acidobacteriota bacterium]
MLRLLSMFSLWLLGRLVGPARFGTLVLKTLVFVVALAVALMMGEIAVRVVFRDITSTADARSYFARQGPEWRMNRFGYREREFAEVKPGGVYRIAVLGDSFTFGQGIPDEERYSNLLQTYLGRDRFEILNFGMPGHDLPQHLDVLERQALAHDADFVLLQLFVNDFELRSTDRPRGLPLLPFPDLDARLYRSSALYSVAVMEWNTVQGMFGLYESYAQYLRRGLEDPHSPGARATSDLLRQFIQKCRDRGVGVGIVFFPNIGFPLDDTYPFRYLHTRVGEICAGEGRPYLDLLPAFARVKPYTKLWVNRFDAHPNAHANRIAAAGIIASFGSAWAKASQAAPPNDEGGRVGSNGMVTEGRQELSPQRTQRPQRKP